MTVAGNPDKVWKQIALPAGLVLFTLIAYIPSARCQFVWDDLDYICNLPAVKSPHGLWAIWTDRRATPQYYPLTFSSFWAEHRLWQLKPLGFHVVNVLLHAANAVLLWMVLRRLRTPGAWLIAAIFALHPINVESVALVAERKNVLSGLFALLALLAYMRFAGWEKNAESGTRNAGQGSGVGVRGSGNAGCGMRHSEFAVPPTPSPRPLTPTGNSEFRIPNSALGNVGCYALAILFFALALLSKSVVATLPVVILLLTWWKRGRVSLRNLATVAPFFVLGAAMGLLTAWIETSQYHPAVRQGALSLAERCQVAGRGLWFYAAKVAWPAGLIPVYPRWAMDGRIGGQYLFAAAALAAVAGLWAGRARIGRGPLTAVLVFAASLLPALGFLPFAYQRDYSFVADHFLYLAAVPLIALAVAAGDRLLVGKSIIGKQGIVNRRAGQGGSSIFGLPLLGWAAGVVLLAGLGARTWRQVGDYTDSLTLWQVTWSANRNCIPAACNLGAAKVQAGELAEGIGLLSRAIEMDAKFVDAYLNRGVALRRAGDLPGAIRDLDRAIELDPKRFKGWDNRGLAHKDAGQLDEAVRDYGRAIELDGSFALAFFHRGGAFVTGHRWAIALRDFDRAEELDPRLGEAFRRDLERAIAECDRALASNPADALALRDRAGLAYLKRDYARAWADVKACQVLGSPVDPEFLADLRRASGRQD